MPFYNKPEQDYSSESSQTLVCYMYGIRPYYDFMLAHLGPWEASISMGIYTLAAWSTWSWAERKVIL